MNHPPTANQARISEIFSSLQGEGIHLGERHLFIRFEECHIHCGYCDELDKKGIAMSLDQVMEEVRRLEKEEGPHAFVSLTGGEPLLYLPFIKPLMMRLKAEHFRIYLETNGILWHALEEVIGWCDSIAMDMKPASVTGEKKYDDDHRRFLEVAKTKETFIKIVLSKEININEFESEIRIVAEIAPETPVILQPVSPHPNPLPQAGEGINQFFPLPQGEGGVREGHEDQDLMELLSYLQRRGSRLVRDIRIVPRFHKILKIR